MQQRAGDLDAPCLSARKVAHLLAGAVGEADELQSTLRALAGFATANAVQRAVIEQVLPQRQVEIQRPALKHDAEALQRCRGAAPDVVPENADLAGDVVVEAGDQREQRRLAGAVEAQEHDEAATRNLERHVVESEILTEGVTDVLDDERRRASVNRLRFRCHIHTTILAARIHFKPLATLIVTLGLGHANQRAAVRLFAPLRMSSLVRKAAEPRAGES